MYNGIKKDGKLYKGSYSKGGYTKESNIPQDTITIYARDYESFPEIEGLQVKNESDSMTDYFVNDRIRVIPTNKYYSLVNEAWEKQEMKRNKIRDKKLLQKTF
jgi:hypothetical protein